MKIIKKILLLLVSILVILLGVLLVNTLRFSSKQLKNVRPADKIELDKDKICSNLSKAIQFRTISNSDISKIDTIEFIALHDYFEKTYLEVHKALTKKVFGNYSLLYKWEGKKTNLNPILLMAHIDVVPAESDKANDDTVSICQS